MTTFSEMEPESVKQERIALHVAGINQQPPEKRDEESGEGLDIVHLFPTIQGEGPFAGHPAVFIRTAGCDLQCPACDTNYTNNRTKVPITEIVRAVKHNSQGWGPRPLVVITGGEPFRQNCGPLVRALSLDYRIQFETNGTLYDPSMRGWWYHTTVVCSPKTGSVAEKMKPVITALKYVLQAGKVDETDGLPTDSLNFGVRPARPWPGFVGQVFIQPCTEQDANLNRLNIEAAVKSCLEHGYILSSRLHVGLGLP